MLYTCQIVGILIKTLLIQIVSDVNLCASAQLTESECEVGASIWIMDQKC